MIISSLSKLFELRLHPTFSQAQIRSDPCLTVSSIVSHFQCVFRLSSTSVGAFNYILHSLIPSSVGSLVATNYPIACFLKMASQTMASKTPP